MATGIIIVILGLNSSLIDSKTIEEFHISLLTDKEFVYESLWSGVAAIFLILSLAGGISAVGFLFYAMANDELYGCLVYLLPGIGIIGSLVVITAIIIDIFRQVGLAFGFLSIIIAITTYLLTLLCIFGLNALFNR